MRAAGLDGVAVEELAIEPAFQIVELASRCSRSLVEGHLVFQFRLVLVHLHVTGGVFLFFHALAELQPFVDFGDFVELLHAFLETLAVVFLDLGLKSFAEAAFVGVAHLSFAFFFFSEGSLLAVEVAVDPVGDIEGPFVSWSRGVGVQLGLALLVFVEFVEVSAMVTFFFFFLAAVDFDEFSFVAFLHGLFVAANRFLLFLELFDLLLFFVEFALELELSSAFFFFGTPQIFHAALFLSIALLDFG